MKKILFAVLMIAVVFAGSVSISRVTRADEPVCEPGQIVQDGQCVYPPSSIPLFLVLASYCKANVVQYTEWSDCDYRFGAHGLQWRQIVYPTPGGCNPSVYDQVNGVRECVK